MAVKELQAKLYQCPTDPVLVEEEIERVLEESLHFDQLSLEKQRDLFKQAIVLLRHTMWPINEEDEDEIDHLR